MINDKKITVAGNTITFRYVHGKPLTKTELAELLVNLAIAYQVAPHMTIAH